MRIAAALTLFLATSLGLADAKAVDLKEALRLAGLSPTMQLSRSIHEEADWKKAEVYQAFMPTVSAFGTRYFSAKYVYTDINFGGNPTSVPGIIPTTAYGFNAQWALFDGFSGVQRYFAAKNFERASRHEMNWSEFRLKREVTVAFYRAIAAKQLRATAEQNFKTLKDHLDEVKQFKRSGVATEFDVLRVEVQFSEAESETISAEDNLKIAEQKLAELLGADAPIESIVGELPILDEAEMAKVQTYKKNREDLAALTEKTEGARQIAGATNKHWVPKISLFGNYQWYNNIDESWSQNFREAYGVGIQAQWNIFDGLSSYAKNREAVEQAYQAERLEKIQNLKGKTDYENFRRKFIYYCSVYRSRARDVVKATEAVRLAKAGRRAGTRTNTELLDAELDLFRAMAGKVNSQLGAVEALSNLEMATGENLFPYTRVGAVE